MGSPESQVDRHPDEFPHRVRISRPFYLGTCEVTQTQYQEILGNNPSYFSASGRGRSRVQDKDTGSLPVESVSWENAIEFCTTLPAREEESKAGRKYMLPTEAQWEYACRSGTQTRYCCGDDKQALLEFAWFAENSSQTTHPVGTKQTNAWGLFDMHGNVREWCQDWYGEDYYRMSPVDDPPGPSTGQFRVFRGGCYALSAYHCRSSNRFGPYSLSSSFMGFRVAFAVSD